MNYIRHSTNYSKFIKNEMIQRKYAQHEIKLLVERFSLHSRTEDPFKDFMYQLANSAKYDHLISLPTKEMWPAILRDSEFTIGPELRDLIRSTLVIAPSSASVERVFSMLNHVKGSRRSRLTASHVEDLVRVVENGPDNLDLFPAIEMAVSWKGHETGARPYKRKNPESVDSQADRPPKQALTSQQRQIEEEEEAQLQREEEYEIALDQEHATDDVIYLQEGPDLDLGEMDRSDSMLDPANIFAI